MSKHLTAWLNEETGEIHLPKCRMVWPNLLEARGIKDDPTSKPKFNVTSLVPKAANLDVFKKALHAALIEKFGKEYAKNKKLLYPLLKTEDQEKLAAYADDFPYIIRASSNKDFPPFIYNPNTTRFDGQPSEIYSGRWALVAGKFFAYDNVSKGVSFGLNRIQLLDHDEPIAGGRIATASGFERFEGVAGGTEFDVSVAGATVKPKAAGATTDAAFNDDEIPF